MTANRVLFVDDMPDMGALIVDVLLLDGIEVDWCASVAEAMALLAAQSYDALVTDLSLGARSPDGEELALQAGAMHPAMPVLFITGDAEAVRRLRQDGRDAMLKPVDIDTLLAWLRAPPKRASKMELERA